MEHTHSADIDKKGSPSVGTATMGIKAPCDHDVLFGRGGGTNNHPGNKAYRKLVLQQKARYDSVTSAERGIVAMDIVRSWRAQDPPGRFLIKADADGLVWNDVADDRVKQKTCQLFRERRRTRDPTRVQPNEGSGINLVQHLQGSVANFRPVPAVPGSNDSIPNLETSSRFLTVQTLLELSSNKIDRSNNAAQFTNHHCDINTLGQPTQRQMASNNSWNNRGSMKEHTNMKLFRTGSARHDAYLRISQIHGVMDVEDTQSTQESLQSILGRSSNSSSKTPQEEIDTPSFEMVQPNAKSSLPDKFFMSESSKNDVSLYERSQNSKTNMNPRPYYMGNYYMGNNHSAISMTAHHQEGYCINPVLMQEFHTQDMRPTNRSYKAVPTIKRGIDVSAEPSLHSVKRVRELSTKAS